MTNESPTESKMVYQCPLFRVYESQIQITAQDGKVVNKTIWYLEKDPWVRIVPFNAIGQIILIKERRLSTQELVWRLPGGGVGKKEEPHEAAVRELMEETALKASVIELLFVEKPTVSWYRQIGYVFAARDVLSTSSASLELGEYIEVVPTSINEVINMANEGRFDAWTEKSLRHGINWYKEQY